MAELSEDVERVFRRAQKEVLLRAPLNHTVMNRDQVSDHLPHRDPLLLIDRVTAHDAPGGLIACTYDLARAAPVFSGHFPKVPLYPGVLQVEAIGQAGILAALLQESQEIQSISLTHILSARFLQPVKPGGELEIIAHIMEDGLFLVVIGQCIKDGVICSAAVLSGLVGEATP